MMRLGEAHEIPLIAMAGSGIGEGRGYTGTLAASLAVVPLTNSPDAHECESECPEPNRQRRTENAQRQRRHHGLARRPEEERCQRNGPHRRHTSKHGCESCRKSPKRLLLSDVKRDTDE